MALPLRASLCEPQDQAFIGLEHEILQLDRTTLSSGMSGQLQEGGPWGIAA
jgi:hypothetical protein